MAFSVRIKGIDRKSERVTLNMELPWWSPQELIGDKRFVETNEGGYLDYDADVSLEEMIAIHEMFVPEATSKMDGCKEWQKIIQPMLQELTEALYIFGGLYSHFHITIFEWESGLD